MIREPLSEVQMRRLFDHAPGADWAWSPAHEAFRAQVEGETLECEGDPAGPPDLSTMIVASRTMDGDWHDPNQPPRAY